MDPPTGTGGGSLLSLPLNSLPLSQDSGLEPPPAEPEGAPALGEASSPSEAAEAGLSTELPTLLPEPGAEAPLPWVVRLAGVTTPPVTGKEGGGRRGGRCLCEDSEGAPVKCSDGARVCVGGGGRRGRGQKHGGGGGASGRQMSV